MEKKKEIYESPKIETVLLECADIVTVSDPQERPDFGDLDDWSKT